MTVLGRVRNLVAKHEYASAISACKNAIKEHPEFYVFYEVLAEIYIILGRSDLAVEFIHKGLGCKPDSIKLKSLRRRLSSKVENKSVDDIFCGKYVEIPFEQGFARLSGGLRSLGELKCSRENEPLVSVVTAVYNNPDSLERCIESVLAQSYGNIEHIIIDGGSDRPTLEILEKYSSKIDYFVSERDNGIYHAMNKGIQVARGDYVCLLNSDDCYHPEFIEKSVVAALSTMADVTYSNFVAGDIELIAQPINTGVFLGHMNICHNTFLVSKKCYDKVGPYDESLKIVSDAVWIRKAFSLGSKFFHVDESLFTLSDGGLSSGATQQHRQLFIREVAESYIKQFPFLTREEAEELYLIRFNNRRLTAILELAEKYLHQTQFIDSLRHYIEYCFKARANFSLPHDESGGLFLDYIKACDLLGVDKRHIRISTSQGCFSKILGEYKSIFEQRKLASKTVIHFVSVFSAAPETFIYDLLLRMEADRETDNFILYEHRLLESERPFAKGLYVPWDDFREEIRNEIYKYLFENICPDVVVAHFALNEWKLSKRIKPLGIKVPTLSMTHGIDVFMLKTNPDYRDYVLEDFSCRKDTKFTAVSNYLVKELMNQGVPIEKIKRIYNTANARFFDNRKCENFFNYKRQLRILSVGRCIYLKGHTDLLLGLRWFIDNCYQNVELTIVYGNGSESIDDVRRVINDLGLDGNVKLVQFVDFSVEQDYFSKFDIYVQASKYSNDAFNRSESFGVAALEAILAGLPVVVTDAGGLPEVVEKNTRFSRIVPHGDGIELGKALKHFFDDPETFTSNEEFARDRLGCFSEVKQLSAIKREIKKLTSFDLKVAMFSTSTSQGAGYAAMRLFRGLRDLSAFRPTLYTTSSNHKNDSGVRVLSHPSGKVRGWSLFQEPDNSKPGLTIFSFNQPSISNSDLEKLVLDCDVINIHWTARFLSVENIAFLSNLGKPLVITVRDMNPISGGCHVFHGCEKWMGDCSGCPQLIDDFENFPMKVLKMKRENYNFNNITLVALSNHTKGLLEKSPMFNRCRIEVIPNSIETDVFAPINKMTARSALGLPLDRKIIGYFPSYSSEVKGYREAIEAFKIVSETMVGDKPLVMLGGGDTPANEAICLDKMSLGYISDKYRLALAYCAADVVIVPSLEETFSNTTAESISCGTPVVGFNTGAIPDLAIRGISGVAVDVGDSNALARGIVEVLESDSLGRACREVALQKLEFSLQASRYEELFLELVSSDSPVEDYSDNLHTGFNHIYQPFVTRLIAKG